MLKKLGQGIAILTFISAGASALAAETCQPATSIPNEAQLGLANILRAQYPNDGIQPPNVLFTVAAPFFTPTMIGKMEDLQARVPNSGLPRKFIISDGGLGVGEGSLPFISIDLTPGSTLKRWLSYLIQGMARKGVNLSNRDAVLAHLKTRAVPMLKDSGPVSCLKRLPRARPSVTQVTMQQFSGLSNAQVSNFVHATGQSYPVVPFEQYVQQFKTFCIHETLMAALILNEVKFPFQIVTGFMADDPHDRYTTGHTWLRVGKNLELDVQWERLGSPVWHSEVRGWQKVGGGWGMPNAHWPILVLE